MGVLYSPKIVQDGLVLMLDAANPKSYPGSGTTWNDLSGNGNNGTLTNGPTFDSGNGGILSFDGTNDYVSIGLQTISSSGGSVVMWVSVDDFSSGKTNTGRIIFRRSGLNFNSVLAFHNNGYTFETLTNSNPHELAGRTVPAVSNSQISPGSWVNFALVFDGGTFYGYVNGSQSGTGAISNNLEIDRIGDGSGFADNYPAHLKGNVGIFQIYNRALTPQEIQQNYNATKSRYNL